MNPQENNLVWMKVKKAVEMLFCNGIVILQHPYRKAFVNSSAWDF